MYKFGQIEISNKEFNSEYKVIENVDLEKIRLSEGVVANKHDTRYTIGYEAEQGKIVPFYMKTPKDCVSSGVSRYHDENSPWKMGFNVDEDKVWIRQYEAISKKIEELLGQKLEGELLNKGKYINPKLITWDGEIRTRFKNFWDKPESIGSCLATGILKMGSVYRKGSNYHLQVYLKECKFKKRDSTFESQLSDDEEDSGCYDKVY